MAKINLLPWREAYRKEKKEQFVAVIGGVVLLSAGTKSFVGGGNCKF